MTGVGDDSQDFVIANHVLEHVEDPLRALKSVSRVLHARGVAYLALPDKRFTFDKDRQITSLDHVIKDHRDGPDWSVAAHYAASMGSRTARTRRRSRSCSSNTRTFTSMCGTIPPC
jgi:ubiquinone/menaquinone biosynthesis C-methylase UbiE